MIIIIITNPFNQDVVLSLSLSLTHPPTHTHTHTYHSHLNLSLRQTDSHRRLFNNQDA